RATRRRAGGERLLGRALPLEPELLAVVARRYRAQRIFTNLARPAALERHGEVRGAGVAVLGLVGDPLHAGLLDAGRDGGPLAPELLAVVARRYRAQRIFTNLARQAALERHGEVRGAGVAVVGLLGDRLHDDLLEPGRKGEPIDPLGERDRRAADLEREV